MIKHQATGNKKTDRAIINLQSQIDELRKQAHPKTTKFDKLQLTSLEKDAKGSKDLLVIDSFKNINTKRVSHFFHGKDLNMRGSGTSFFCDTQSLGATVTAGDFAASELRSKAFLMPTKNIIIKSFKLFCTFSTAAIWEFKLIDFTIPADSATTLSTINTISTNKVNGGVAIDANDLYSVTINDLNYRLNKGHGLIYAWKNYTASGSKTAYGQLTLEIEM